MTHYQESANDHQRDHCATKRKLDRDEMLTRLVESHLRYRKQGRRIAELTLSYWGRELPPSRPISEIQIDAGKVAQAMTETYGTNDIIEIINTSWKGSVRMTPNKGIHTRQCES